MRFVYPQSLLAPRLIDEMFQEEANGLMQAGFTVSRIDSEMLSTSPSAIKPPVDSGEMTVYRGWMMTAGEYQNLVDSVTSTGGQPITTPQQYLATHHLPNWWKRIAEFTPETVVLAPGGDLADELLQLGWPKFFIKDFVKSLKTSVGSIIERPEDIRTVVAEMEKYRGTIEGGLCVRRVEDFLVDTEKRYFVINGKPFASDEEAEIPSLVFECTKRIDSNFFSIDVVQRRDGQLRVVELGDGQVSDLVGWSVTRFVQIWQLSYAV